MALFRSYRNQRTGAHKFAATSIRHSHSGGKASLAGFGCPPSMSRYIEEFLRQMRELLAAARAEGNPIYFG